MENSETVIHREQNRMLELMAVCLTCSFNTNIYIYIKKYVQNIQAHEECKGSQDMLSKAEMLLTCQRINI